MASPSKKLGIGRQLCCQSDCLETGPPRIYSPHLKKTHQTSKYCIYELGVKNPSVPHKTVILVGATGSGKSTLVNGLFNYIIGVNWEDQYRFKLVQEKGQNQNQAKSQTQAVSVYTIHYQKGFNIPFSITFIDTPGYGDTSGVLQDNKISDQLRALFNSGGEVGINNIDAVGFVVQSALTRLTTAQRYIFDSILNLFGKDIAQSIYFLVTFSDARKPQVLAGIEAAKLPYQSYFKFNNSVLYICKPNEGTKTPSNSGNPDDSDSDEDPDFNDMYWKMGQKSYRLFLNTLQKTEPRSLQMTQEVMGENKALQLSIKGLQTEIRLGLNKLEQLDLEKAVLKQYEADLENNRDFEYSIVEESTEAVPVSTGQYTTNCTVCNRTCHDRCSEREDSRKHACSAMTRGFCTVCPGKCAWSKHLNQPYLYKVIRVKVNRCAQDLKVKYQQAKVNYDSMRCNSRLQAEFEQVQSNVMKMVQDIRETTARLEKISLKADPRSTADYIELQLQTEKSQAEPGWQWRIKQLQKLKQQAEYKVQISNDNFTPFKQNGDGSRSVMAATSGSVKEVDEDDEKYRHPTIEKLQSRLNLAEILKNPPKRQFDEDSDN